MLALRNISWNKLLDRARKIEDRVDLDAAAITVSFADALGGNVLLNPPNRVSRHWNRKELLNF